MSDEMFDDAVPFAGGEESLFEGEVPLEPAIVSVLQVHGAAPDEELPLIPGGADRKSSTKKKVAIIGSVLGAGVLAGGAAGLYFWLRPNGGSSPTPTPTPPNGCSEPDTTITYTTTILNAYGRTFCILNNGNQTYNISSIQFTTNVDITPYPPLPPQLILTKVLNILGNYNYTLSAPDALPLSENSTYCLTYTFVAGPDFLHQIGLNPQNTSLILSNNSTMMLPINGTQACAPNFVKNYEMGGWLRLLDVQRYPASSLPTQIQPKLNTVHFLSFGVDGTTGKLTSVGPTYDNVLFPLIQDFVETSPSRGATIVLSGYCTSGVPFEQLTANDQLLNNFATNVAYAVKQYGFTGVTLDWEFWGNTCKTNSTFIIKLFNATRTSFDEVFGKGKGIIRMTIPVGQDKISQLTTGEWCEISQKVDSFELISYTPIPSPLSNFETRLDVSPYDPTRNTTAGTYTIKDSVAAYRNMSCISLRQIIVGVPAFGHGSFVSQMNQHGYAQTISGVLPGEYGDGSGSYSNQCVINKICYSRLLPGDTALIPADKNPFGNMPWGYSNGSLVVVSYVDSFAAGEIADYITHEGLGGASICATMQDLPFNNSASITRAMVSTLSGEPLNQTSSQKRFTFDPEVTARYPKGTLEPLTQLFSTLPTDLFNTFVEAAKTGFLYGFLISLTNESLKSFSQYLKEYGYKKEYIDFANTVIQAAITVLAGSLFGTAAFFATKTLMYYGGGFSSETSQIAGTVAATAVNFAYASMTVTAAATVIGGGYVGAKIGNGVVKAGTNIARLGLFGGLRKTYNDITSMLPVLPTTRNDLSAASFAKR
jgi:GH18 family chitinase